VDGTEGAGETNEDGVRVDIEDDLVEGGNVSEGAEEDDDDDEDDDSDDDDDDDDEEDEGDEEASEVR
jgi:hypothetical protein